MKNQLRNFLDNSIIFVYLTNMEEKLLSLLETVLGKSKKTSGDNYAFFSPFVNHYKPKLEINIKLNSNGNNRTLLDF